MLIELNEVTNTVLDRQMASQPDSALSAMLAASARCETMLPHRGLLEPWVVWPSIHRGVPNWVHGIEALGQPCQVVDAATPPLWVLAADAGVRVGIFGSLHARTAPPSNVAFFVPDYFSAEDAQPQWLNGFHKFNSGMTQRSRHNVSGGVHGGGALSVVRITRPRTLAAIAGQLAGEIVSPSRRVHRRALQTTLMGDAFMAAVAREAPQFSSIFVNSVATALHRYWSAAWPDDFESLPISDEFQHRYRDAISTSFRYADSLFAGAMEWAKSRDGVVVIASGFGQRPVPTVHTFRFLTIVDPEKFARAMGLADHQFKIHATMTPYFSFEVDPSAAGMFETALRSLRIGSHALADDEIARWPLSARQISPGFFSVYFQFDDYRGEQLLTLLGGKIPFAQAGIGMERNDDGVQYTAYHTTRGSLTVYDPLGKRDIPAEIDALDIAPSILSALDVAVPPFMHGSPDVLAG
jgi:hypothetical protein